MTTKTPAAEILPARFSSKDEAASFLSTGGLLGFAHASSRGGWIAVVPQADGIYAYVTALSMVLLPDW